MVEAADVVELELVEVVAVLAAWGWQAATKTAITRVAESNFRLFTDILLA